MYADIQSLNNIFLPKQGHLTRFLSYGLGLKVTTIEADATLVEMASKFDRELEWTLEKEQKRVSTKLRVVFFFFYIFQK